MKNYQQTPRQRRVAMSKSKQRLRASKPRTTFQQAGDWWNIKNIVHHHDKRL